MPENAKQTPPDSFQANMDTAEPVGASAAASAGRKSVLAASGAPLGPFLGRCERQVRPKRFPRALGPLVRR